MPDVSPYMTRMTAEQTHELYRATKSLIEEIWNFHENLDAEGEIKQKIALSIQKINELNTFYGQVFTAESDGTSKKQKILTWHENIKTLHHELLLGDEDEESIEDQILIYKNELESFYTNEFDELKNFYESLEGAEGIEGTLIKKRQIEEYYRDVFEGAPSTEESGHATPSIKAQINEFRKSLSEYKNNQLVELKEFHTKIFGDKDGNASLANELSDKEEQLDDLTNKSFDLYQKITDLSLNNIFDTRAKKYSGSLKSMSYAYIALLALASICYGLLFTIPLFAQTLPTDAAEVSSFQIIANNLKDQLAQPEFLRFLLGVTIPIVVVSWFINREIKILRRLAEEYWHKATLVGLLISYRKEYDLNHADTEYRDLLNAAQKQFNNNPAESIDPYLLKKQPQEKIISSLEDNIQKFINQINDNLTNSK